MTRDELGPGELASIAQRLRTIVASFACIVVTATARQQAARQGKGSRTRGSLRLEGHAKSSLTGLCATL
jgi:hypothetical protein